MLSNTWPWVVCKKENSISKIDSFNSDTIEIGNKELPIGRLFKHDVSKLLNASSVRPNANPNAKNKSGTD